MERFLTLSIRTNIVINSNGDEVVQIFVTSEEPIINISIGLTTADFNEFVDRYLYVLRAEILRQLSLCKVADCYDIERSNFDEIKNFVLNLRF